MRNNLMMTDKEFNEGILKFDELEKRGSFYDMDDKKTFTKAVDEYNYVNITLPIQNMEKENQEKKRRHDQRKILGSFWIGGG